MKDGKVLSHVGFKSKVLHKPLTDLSAWLGFCTSSPQQDVAINWSLARAWFYFLLVWLNTYTNVIIIYNFIYLLNKNPTGLSGRRCHDRMVVGFTTTYASSAYQH